MSTESENSQLIDIKDDMKVSFASSRERNQAIFIAILDGQMVHYEAS